MVAPLLFALYLLTDDDTSSDLLPSHHLAVLTALRRHPPSLRVFRALSELTLLLMCAAFSLWVWESKDGIGTENVGRLLFDFPKGMEEYEIEFENGGGGRSRGRRRRVSSGLGEYETASEGDNGEGFILATGDGDVEDDFVSVEGDDDGIDDLERELSSATPSSAKSGGNNGDVPLSACDAAAPLSDEDLSEAPLPEPPSSPLTKSPPTTPSSASVLSAALDLLLLLLVCLFLFTISSAEGGRYIDHLGDPSTDTNNVALLRWIGETTAPVFPLLLFFAAAAMAVLPWKRRRGFWTVISYTIMAPYHDVTFRDGFIGDIFTSTVRPLQDLAFTVFYLCSGLQGWWSSAYGLESAALPVERSWLLHTVVLPGCMVSPLWWRFLQNLRQTHDARQRWPYLGNALKYFVAAEVALFGVFAPNAKDHAVWIMCFTGATLYQVWWDVFMDWELLEYAPGTARGADGSQRQQRWWPFRLRSTRLYSSRWTYYCIFVINFLLRFCWTLSFIPRNYLSRTGSLVDAFGADFQTFVGPALASAEIIRRTLWGLIRLELETIKTSGKGDKGTETEAGNKYDLSGRDHHGDEELPLSQWEDGRGGDELKPMSIGTSGGPSSMGRIQALGPLLESSAVTFRSDMATMTDVQIMGELCLWGTAFTSLGILAAAHRQVM